MTEQRRTELEQTLERMVTASNNFYGSAVKTGCHAFIEFTGLMNEFIEVSRMALRNGEDFTEFNKHQGQHLELAEHQIDYINEKLDCIYGRILEIH